MFNSKIRLYLFLGVFFVIVFPSQQIFANLDTQSIPPDFSLVSSATGTELYRKNYSGGNPDFVQIVNYDEGAAIKLGEYPLTARRTFDILRV